MPITDNELINASIRANGITNLSGLAEQVDQFIKSPLRQEKITGWNYYLCQNDINNKRRKYINWRGELTDLKAKKNTKIPHAFQSRIVDMDIDYMFGNSPSYITDDTNSVSLMNEIISEAKRTKLFREWLKGAENSAVSYIYPFIDTNTMSLKFTLLRGYEIQLHRDDLTNEVVGAFRVVPDYAVYNGKREKIYRVTTFELNGMTRYIFKDGKLVIEPNIDGSITTPYFTFSNRTNGEVLSQNWGFIPILPLYFNEEEIPLIRKTKALIDEYDSTRSDFGDQISDLQMAFIKLKNLMVNSDDPESMAQLERLVDNIRASNVIPLQDDADAEVSGIDVPYLAIQEHVNKTSADTYSQAMSVDPNDQSFAQNLSGVSIAFKYKPLNIKTNSFEILFNEAFEMFVTVMNRFLEVTNRVERVDSSMTVKFNRDIPINAKEHLEALNIASNDLSQRTRLENNPFVSDVDKELERLEDEAGTIILDTSGGR